MDQPDEIAASEGSLYIAGSKDGRSRLIEIDLSDGSESLLMEAPFRIEELQVLADTSVLFAGKETAGPGGAVGLLAKSRGRTEVRRVCLLDYVPKSLADFSSLHSEGDTASSESTDSPTPLGNSGMPGGTQGLTGTEEGPLIYSIQWNSFGYANGRYEIRAEAVDSSGQTASDSITVDLGNVEISLEASRVEVASWLVRKQYASLAFRAVNPSGTPLAKYVITRKEGAGSFQVLAEIPASQVAAAEFTYEDRYINGTSSYTYLVEAFDAENRPVGRSNASTI